MSSYDAALATLAAFIPRDAAQQELQSTYLAHLHTHANGLRRECHPAHLTASALVLSPDRAHILLHRHARYGIWVQFGGHLEPGDDSLAAGALREAEEESGIPDLMLLSEQPAQLDTHLVRCGPAEPSYHLDVRFLAVAPPDAEPQLTAESLDVRWFARDELPSELDSGLKQLIAWSR